MWSALGPVNKTSDAPFLIIQLVVPVGSKFHEHEQLHSKSQPRLLNCEES